MVSRLTPGLELAQLEVKLIPDYTRNKVSALGKEGGVQLLVTGAVAEVGGVQTDETAAARNDTGNDLTLMRSSPVVGDAYYICGARPYNRVWLNIGQAGVGNWANTEEYWNGAAWVNLAGASDLTSQFMADGMHRTTFTLPGEWAVCTVLGITGYWMRYRLSSLINLTTQPKGTQAWYEYFI
jgi:hypothetical protein